MALKWDCPLSVKDNAEDPRVFAHALHYKNTICLHPLFEDLKDEFKCGILLHEMGHVFGGEEEAEADLWVDEQLRIAIKYRDMLQWVPVRRLRK